MNPLTPPSIRQSPIGNRQCPPFLLVALAVALTSSGCMIAGDYRIADGATKQRSFHSIAGSVHVGRDAVINSAKTIAGEIHVDRGASTRSLRTIAGDIRIGENAKVDGDVTTIAGGIHLAAGTRVSGKVTTIAGTIALHDCRVDGSVRVTKGTIATHGATVLPAGIVVRHPTSMDDPVVPQIDIGPGADVASIHIEPDTEVELRVSRAARVGKITGATATYYE